MNPQVQDAVASAVAALSPQELEDLAAGRGRLVFRPHEPATQRAHRAARREPARRALAIDISEVVATINGFTRAVDVAAYLDGLDARFTVPVLKEIARAIGPTVATTGRTKAQVQRDIVEGTVGFRERTTAMSGGAWA